MGVMRAVGVRLGAKEKNQYSARVKFSCTTPGGFSTSRIYFLSASIPQHERTDFSV